MNFAQFHGLLFFISNLASLTQNPKLNSETEVSGCSEIQLLKTGELSGKNPMVDNDFSKFLSFQSLPNSDRY